ncbi:DUF6612 family protein [Solibacillus sp. CAU 1738]|uniref:DUF6612 family protein n=1 Tax=Solibacillus sp. CAU 1738 TaxID=3140363 RepID=UPI0032616507
MKKKMFIALAGVAVLTAGCGSSATTTEGTTKESKLTLEQVFDKAVERQQEIKSLKATTTMTQAMEMNDGTETIKMNSSADMSMEIVIDPMQFFIDGTMSMTDDASGETLDMPLKMYMTAEDGFYMYESTSQSWLKLPSDLYDTMLEQAGMQADATEQLKMLQKYVTDFTFEQSDSDYILTLNADGEQFTQLIKDQLASTMPNLEEDISSQFDQMTFDDSMYKLIIDKETFDTKEIVMDMILSMEVEGAAVKLDQKSTTTYKEINTISNIEIPQDVLDNAIEN